MDFGLLLTNRPSLVYNCITVEHNRFMFTIHGKMIELNKNTQHLFSQVYYAYRSSSGSGQRWDYGFNQ